MAHHKRGYKQPFHIKHPNANAYQLFTEPDHVGFVGFKIARSGQPTIYYASATQTWSKAPIKHRSHRRITQLPTGLPAIPKRLQPPNQEPNNADGT